MNSDFDLIIAGGGPTGIAAGVAAGRLGARVLVIERYGFLGGMSTAALVNPWLTFHNSQGKQVVAGIAQEIADRLIALDACAGHLRDTVGFVYSVTAFDPETLKFVAQEMLTEAGARLLLHSFIVEARIQKDSVHSVVVRNKSGEQAYSARYFVDCTGDGDLAALAGVPFEKGRRADGATQPMTMNFRVGGVDLAPVVKYIRENPQEFHHQTTFDQLEPLTGVSGFFTLWKEANLPIVRDRLLFFAGVRQGEVNVNTSRIVGKDGTNVFDLTDAEIEGKRQVKMIIDFLRAKIPGFENCYLIALPTQIGLRETRRIFGEYLLTGEDVLNGRRFDDGIARSAYPIDIHNPKDPGLTFMGAPDDAYDIPYRCLLPQKVENLWVAGRCFSATHEGHSSARLTITCMSMGQAAGTAAALALERRCLPREVDVSALREKLRKQGSIVD
jgi:hypothetical protein